MKILLKQCHYLQTNAENAKQTVELVERALNTIGRDIASADRTVPRSEDVGIVLDALKDYQALLNSRHIRE